MATIVTRQTGATAQNRPLTNAEVDNNFINLNNAIVALTSLVNAGGSGGGSKTILNDISNQFNGVTRHFKLKLEQDIVSTITNSKDLEVVIDGLRLSPYIARYTWPWLMVYDSFKGYRVRTFDSQNYITIYNAPDAGSNALLILGSSSTPQTSRYPFSAATVALGD
jgi:hypothetical protein